MASPPPAAPPRPGIVRLFLVFAKIGLLSFGGGSSTLVLMQQECMERTRWLTVDQFTFTYALSRMYPGIHLLAQAVLIGFLLQGLPGAIAASLGMLVPASAVTIVFTIFFVQVTANPIGKAALDGLLPATAGLTMAVVYRLTLDETTGHRVPAQVASLAIIVASFLALSVFGVNSALVVILSGMAGIVLFRLIGGMHGPA
jgi:chromate transporter